MNHFKNIVLPVLTKFDLCKRLKKYSTTSILLQTNITTAYSNLRMIPFVLKSTVNCHVLPFQLICIKVSKQVQNISQICSSALLQLHQHHKVGHDCSKDL